MPTTELLTSTEIRAPRGTKLRCKGWKQEAAMRMLMNNLDPEVAERPQDLVVYGGTGKAARDWAAYHAIVRELEALGNDETLLVQSGKPVGVFRTHEEAPRVLIANANLVGHWSNWEEFRQLEQARADHVRPDDGGKLDLHRLARNSARHVTKPSPRRRGSTSAGSLAGKLVVTGGMGGMGGAQPLAATMNGAAFLGVEVDAKRIERRHRIGLLRPHDAQPG